MKEKNYYEEIDKAIWEYETFRPHPQHTTLWIVNRIDWCWRFRKITKSQMIRLCDRMIDVYQTL